MKPVIKLQDAMTDVRAIAMPRPAPRLSEAERVFLEERVALEDRIAALSRELAEQTVRLAALQKDRDRAFQEGEIKGHAAGRSEGDRFRTDALARLEGGLKQAMQTYDMAMPALERLAVTIAHAALEKLLADPGDHKRLAAELIRKQLDDLEAQSVVRVEVSPTDFPDVADLTDLAIRLHRAPGDIAASHDLPAGACRIRLVLGTLHVGLNQQWGQLDAILGELAQPAGAT